MSRRALPELARRVPVPVTLSRAAVAVLDAAIEAGKAATRSAAVEQAILAWFAAVPRETDRGRRKRR